MCYHAELVVQGLTVYAQVERRTYKIGVAKATPPLDGGRGRPPKNKPLPHVLPRPIRLFFKES